MRRQRFLVACQSAWYKNVIKTFSLFLPLSLVRSLHASWLCAVARLSGRVFAIFHDSTLHKYDLLVLVIFVTSILRISFFFFSLLFFFFIWCAVAIRFRRFWVPISSPATKGAHTHQSHSIGNANRENLFRCDCLYAGWCRRCCCVCAHAIGIEIVEWKRCRRRTVTATATEYDVFWLTQFCTIYFHTTYRIRDIL